MVTHYTSTDGTIKFVFELDDASTIETVLIPQKKDKYCVCVSSQVGCALKCDFCVTGHMGYKRNLTTDEIVMQLSYVWEYLHPIVPNSVVFMGMGEPFLNYDAVLEAIKILNDRKRFNFAEHKITVSTAGVVKKIANFGTDTTAKLAISLHAATDEKRSKIMPINNRYPLKSLMDACRAFPTTRRRLIMFEYTLFDGFNDTDEDVEQLVALFDNIPVLVNLIPYNDHQFCDMKPTPMDRVEIFKRKLMDAGIKTFIRETKGYDISAACGLLAGKATL